MGSRWAGFLVPEGQGDTASSTATALGSAQDQFGAAELIPPSSEQHREQSSGSGGQRPSPPRGRFTAHPEHLPYPGRGSSELLCLCGVRVFRGTTQKIKPSGCRPLSGGRAMPCIPLHVPCRAAPLVGARWCCDQVVSSFALSEHVRDGGRWRRPPEQHQHPAGHLPGKAPRCCQPRHRVLPQFVLAVSPTDGCHRRKLIRLLRRKDLGCLNKSSVWL